MLTAILDRLIPVSTVTRRPRTSDPWFDEECRTAKRLTRRLERAATADAKRSDNTAAASAKHAWQTQRRSYRTLRNRKREAFWLNTVAANQSSSQHFIPIYIQLFASEILVGNCNCFIPVPFIAPVGVFPLEFREKFGPQKTKIMWYQPTRGSEDSLTTD